MKKSSQLLTQAIIHHDNEKAIELIQKMEINRLYMDEVSVAIDYNNLEVLKYFVNNFNLVLMGRYMRQAVTQNNKEVLEIFFNSEIYKNTAPTQALVEALKSHNMPMVRFALQAGASLIGKEDTWYKIGEGSHPDIIQHVIDLQPCPTVLNGIIHSPEAPTLRLAAMEAFTARYPELISLDTIAQSLSARKSSRLTALLLKRNPGLDLKNSDLLCLACEKQDVRAVKFLIREKVNIHAHDEEPLNWAIRHSNREITAALIDAGADLEHEKIQKSMQNNNNIRLDFREWLFDYPKFQKLNQVLNKTLKEKEDPRRKIKI